MTTIIIGSVIVLGVIVAFVLDNHRVNRKLTNYYEEQKHIGHLPLGRFRFPHNHP